MLLLSLLVETGQLPGAGLTQADKTCIHLNFYLEILKGGHLGFKGGQSAPPAPLNATLRGYGYASLAPVLNRRPKVAETPPWTETGS